MPLTREIREEISSTIKATINDLFTKDTKFIEKVAEKVADKIALKSLQQQVIKHDNEITVLRNEVNKIDQYSRRTSMRFTGLPEVIDENISHTIINLMNVKLKIPITEKDIEECFRVGKDRLESKPRPVFLKIISLKLKNDIMKSKKLLKGSKIRIYEDLTRNNYNLYKRCVLKREWQNVWTANGKILVKDRDGIIKEVNEDAIIE